MFYGAGAAMCSCLFYGSQLLCKIAKGFIFFVDVQKTVACLSELQAKTCSSSHKADGMKGYWLLSCVAGQSLPHWC